MKKFTAFILFAIIFVSCAEDEENYQRYDSAVMLGISVSGSLQNPAFSPDSQRIVFTRFRNGYNEEPADLFILNLGDNSATTLVSDGSGNVNLPGSAWKGTNIVFSSSREPHDEIYIISESGTTGDEDRITIRTDVAYEPSFSPNGDWIVFESHVLDVEGNGIITKYKVDQTEVEEALTDLIYDGDCRQPNWSPNTSVDLIVYQKIVSGQWELFTMKSDGNNKTQITSGPGDKTDASFSPDGDRIVYSADNSELEFANIFVIPSLGGTATRVTNYGGYDGAPSWSPDGEKIIFESYPGDPDDTSGTTLWIIDAP